MGTSTRPLIFRRGSARGTKGRPAWLLGLFLALPGLALAAPPPNDNLADALVIGGLPYTYSGTNLEATPESETICGNGGLIGNSVWWVFTPVDDAYVQIDTAGSDFDTQLNIFSGPTATFPLTCVAGDDDAGPGVTSSITQLLAGGLNYFIAVDGFGSDQGNVTLNVAEAPVPTVNIAVSRSYSVSHPTATDPQVEVTLTCPTATVDGGTNSASKMTSGGVANFSITGYPIAGEDCTATQTVPAGYAEQSNNCTALNVAFGVSPAPSCTITNQPTEAEFVVDLQFSDGNEALDVSVTPLCTDAGGGPGITYTPSTAQAGELTDAPFTVRYFDGAANCTATESGPAGYTQIAAPAGIDCTDTGVGIADSDTTPPVCVIHNDQDPVEIQASKVYPAGFGPDSQFSVSCSAGTVTPPTAVASPGNPAVFTVEDFPWQGMTCSVTEPNPPLGFPQAVSSCDSLDVAPGAVAVVCAIAVPDVYKGIPTLSQYGLALLTLLMMGVGMVGMRRAA